MSRQSPDREPVNARYGAPMGRPSDTDITGKCHLTHVPLVSGCYDRGGAYWGAPADLWCLWSDDGAEAYLRAPNRSAAREAFVRKYPGIRFYR